MEDLESIDRAIAALESQRGALGDDVVRTAVQPLLQRRAALQAAADAERRALVTVLFADLVDFTVLSRRLDAEDTRSVVNAYFRCWSTHIEAHGGVVEKFIGDAVMAVFGLHRAREDDAHAAIRAALAMTATLPELNADLEARFGVRLTMRVGIDTGDVVVSLVDERPGHAFVAVGETVNRASRLQSAAPPGGVLISPATFAHVRGGFAFRPMPGLQLKGIPDPVDAYAVLSERPREFRLDPARGVEGVETSTVGRDPQLRQLQDRLRDVVEDRRWQVLTVIGDAGVGKSRLLLELDRWLAESPEVVWWFRGRAWQSGQNRAGALLRDVVAARFGIQDSDTPQVVREQCLRGFETAFGPGPATARRAHVVGTWLGFETGPDGDQDVPRDPQGLRDEGTLGLAEYFARLAETSPVVVLLEDLHWADDATLAWIDAAHAVLRDSPVFLVGTARPTLFERRPHWGEGLDHHARMPLGPLSRRESRALLAQLLGRVEEVPPSLTDLVVTAAEGNPFYLEELVKWLLDSGVITRDGDRWRVRDDQVRAARVPSTLRGVLQARLDALTPPERAVLQRASVIGRVFWDEAVEHLSADGASAGADSGSALHRLRRHEVVYERERSSFDETTEFLFKHALLREVAYDGILRPRRQVLHGLAAAWLEEVTRRSSRTDEYAALIAEHLDRAGHPAAGAWYLRAGRRAVAIHALDEAARLLARGLAVAADGDRALRFDLHATREELLDRMGNRQEQEADLAAMEAVVAGLDDPARRSASELARARWHFGRSAYDDAADWALRAAATAAAAGLAEREADARLWSGKALTWQFRHDEARTVLEVALAKARLAGRAPLVGESLRYLSMVASNASDFPAALGLLQQALEVVRAGGDLEGESRVLAQFATVYYNLGRYDDATQRLEESLPVFRLSGHRYREAVALSNLASIAVTQGYVTRAQAWATTAVDMLERIRDREAIAVVRIVLGQLRLYIGDLEGARRQLLECLERGQEVEHHAALSDCLNRLALVAMEEGRTGEARPWATRALEEARKVEAPLEEGYAHLVRGYVLLADGVPGEAAVDFSAAQARFADLGRPSLVREAQAGRAAAALGDGRGAVALELVEPLLAHLGVEDLEGCIRPADLLLTCLRVLEAGADPRVRELPPAMAAFLTERLRRLGDDGLREPYLRVPAIAEVARHAGLAAPPPVQAGAHPKP